MIDENQIEELCLKGESVTLDYKSEQYKFNGDKNEKSELLKDILSFANAWREGNAYILIGVSEGNGKGEITGIEPKCVIDDATIQQFINSKTNEIIPFSCYSVDCKKGLVHVIEIEECGNGRPFYIIKDFGNVKKDIVKIRRGTSTDEASTGEIVKMTEAKISNKKPILDAYICAAGSDNYSKEAISLCAWDVDFKNQHPIGPFNPTANYVSSLLNISEEDKQEWIAKSCRICSINLKLKNISDVQAKDLKIQTKISNASMKIKELDSYPSKPERYTINAPITSRSIINRNISIHPKDEYIEEKIIYLSPEDSGEADFAITVFGENLVSPLNFNFKLRFLIEKKTLTSEYLKNEYWELLEEDSIFKHLSNTEES